MLSDLSVREAEQSDLEAIVQWFASDHITHHDAWNETNRPLYETAFRTIAESADTTLYAVLERGALIGTFMLTFHPVIYGKGAHRMILEGVRVAPARRSRGVGRFILDFTERTAREKGAKQVVLTSNKQRLDAHRFYEKNGYHKGHDGFKKVL